MKFCDAEKLRDPRIATHAAFAAIAAFALPGPLLADSSVNVEAGARVAHAVTRGNCLACHAMPSDPTAVTSTNIGPPLVAMKARFPDREKLRAQLWNAGAANANTVMPPFGKNRILSRDEIEQLIDYLYTL